MNVFIADLNTICNWDDLVNDLTRGELARYRSWTRAIRAKQFLVAHSIRNTHAQQFKYTSIAHSNNFVIVGASNSPIGVDIEDTTRQRDFDSMSKFMNFTNIKTAEAFYRAFTLSEAKYKLSAPATNTRFYKLGTYMICIVSDDTEIIWESPTLVPKQI